MKKLWRWILSLFSKRIRAELREADINELRWQSPSMFKRFARLFTGQWRPIPGPNMPKYQPCPECHAGAKRDRKTVAGAIYICNRGDGFAFMVVNKAAAAGLTVDDRIKVGAV